MSADGITPLTDERFQQLRRFHRAAAGLPHGIRAAGGEPVFVVERPGVVRVRHAAGGTTWENLALPPAGRGPDPVRELRVQEVTQEFGKFLAIVQSLERGPAGEAARPSAGSPSRRRPPQKEEPA